MSLVVWPAWSNRILCRAMQFSIFYFLNILVKHILIYKFSLKSNILSTCKYINLMAF